MNPMKGHEGSFRCFSFPVFFLILALSLLPSSSAFTEIFNIAKDSDDSTYYVGNQDSNFFIGKRNEACSSQWTTTAGSTSGDNDNDENTEILYDVLIGSDGLVYAVGSTRGNFSFPSEEVANLDAAVLVYDASSGNLVRQMQYDIQEGNNNIARAIVQKADGNLLVAVFGSISNIQSTALYETRLLEIDATTLVVSKVYSIDVTTTELLFPVTGGPKIVDFIYEEESNTIIALGHILGRGILWRYSLETEQVTGQIEWGAAFGNFEISAFTTDGAGAFFVVGSSSTAVLSNSDLLNPVSADFHAYVIRFDSEASGFVSQTWVRQLTGDGSSQSGNDITIDPVTNELVIIGSFDAAFQVTDSQTSTTFEVNTIDGGVLTDIYIWYLEPTSGNFSDLRLSSASTTAEDHGNAVAILSNRRVEIGGVRNDGSDNNPSVCDDSNTVGPISPSPSPIASLNPSPTSLATSSVVPIPLITVSPVVSQTATISPTAQSSIVVGPTVSSAPSIIIGPSLAPNVDASSSPSPLISESGISQPSGSSAFSPSISFPSVTPLTISSSPVTSFISTPVPSASLSASVAPSPTSQSSTASTISSSPLLTLRTTPENDDLFISTSVEVSVPSEEPSESLDVFPTTSASMQEELTIEPQPSDIPSESAEFTPFASLELDSSPALSQVSQSPDLTDSGDLQDDTLIRPMPSATVAIVEENSSTSPEVSSEQNTLETSSESDPSDDITDEDFTGSIEPSLQPDLLDNGEMSDSPDPSEFPAITPEEENAFQTDEPIVSSDVLVGPTVLPEASQSPQLLTDIFSPVPELSTEPRFATPEFTGSEILDMATESQEVSTPQLGMPADSPIQSMGPSPEDLDDDSSLIPSSTPGDVDIASPLPSNTIDSAEENGTPSPDESALPSENADFSISPEYTPEPTESEVMVTISPEEMLTVSPSTTLEELEELNTSTSPDLSISPEVSMEPSPEELQDFIPSPSLLVVPSFVVPTPTFSIISPDVLQESEQPTIGAFMEESVFPEASSTPSLQSLMDSPTEIPVAPSPDISQEFSTNIPGQSIPSDSQSPSPSFLGPKPQEIESFSPTPLASQGTLPSLGVSPFPALPSETPELVPSSTPVLPTTILPSAEITTEVTPTAEITDDNIENDPTASAMLTLEESNTGNLDEMSNSSPDSTPDAPLESSSFPIASELPRIPETGSPRPLEISVSSSPEASDGVSPSIGGEEIFASPTVSIFGQLSSSPPQETITQSVLPTPVASVKPSTVATPIPEVSQPITPRPFPTFAGLSPPPTTIPVAISTPSSSPGSAFDRKPGTITPTPSSGVNENVDFGSITPRSTPSASPFVSTLVDISASLSPEPTASSENNSGGDVIIIDLGSATPQPTPSVSPPASTFSGVSASNTPVPTASSGSSSGGETIIIDLGSATPQPSSSVSASSTFVVSEVTPSRTPTATNTGEVPDESDRPNETEEISDTPDVSTDQDVPTAEPVLSSPLQGIPTSQIGIPSRTPEIDEEESSSPSLETPNVTAIVTPEPSNEGQASTPSVTDDESTTELTTSPLDETLEPSPESSASPDILLGSVEPSVSPEAAIFSPTSEAEFSESPEASMDIEEPSISPMLLTPSPDVSPSISPRETCVGRAAVVEDSLLTQTANFQRVKMGIQIAGLNLTSSCGFTALLAAEFIELSAANTLSHAFLWFITGIENGPAIFSDDAPLVVVDDLDIATNITVGNPSVSPSPAIGSVNALLYPTSIIFNVTVFFEPLSVLLARGSYVEYITSQNIVAALQEVGATEIAWTGMLGSPQILDSRSTSTTGTTSLGITASIITGAVFGAVLLIGTISFMYTGGFAAFGGSTGPLLPV